MLIAGKVLDIKLLSFIYFGRETFLICNIILIYSHQAIQKVEENNYSEFDNEIRVHLYRTSSEEI